MRGDRDVARLSGLGRPWNVAGGSSQGASVHSLDDHDGNTEPGNFQTADQATCGNRRGAELGDLEQLLEAAVLRALEKALVRPDRAAIAQQHDRAQAERPLDAPEQPPKSRLSNADYHLSASFAGRDSSAAM
jgi:hypothetical protein